MGSRLYVGNLPFNTNDAQLKAFLEEGGHPVISVRIITDRETGRSRGFAFVDTATTEESLAIIKDYNGREFQGRALTINEARERQPNTGGAGGGGGGGAGGAGERRPGGFRNGGPPSGGGYKPSFPEPPRNNAPPPLDTLESRAEKLEGYGRGRNDRGKGGKGGKGGFDRDRGGNTDRGGRSPGKQRGGAGSKNSRISYEEDDDF